MADSTAQVSKCDCSAVLAAGACCLLDDLTLNGLDPAAKVRCYPLLCCKCADLPPGIAPVSVPGISRVPLPGSRT